VYDYSVNKINNSNYRFYLVSKSSHMILQKFLCHWGVIRMHSFSL